MVSKQKNGKSTHKFRKRRNGKKHARRGLNKTIHKTKRGIKKRNKIKSRKRIKRLKKYVGGNTKKNIGMSIFNMVLYFAIKGAASKLTKSMQQELMDRHYGYMFILNNVINWEEFIKSTQDSNEINYASYKYYFCDNPSRAQPRILNMNNRLGVLLEFTMSIWNDLTIIRIIGSDIYLSELIRRIINIINGLISFGREDPYISPEIPEFNRKTSCLSLPPKRLTYDESITSKFPGLIGSVRFLPIESKIIHKNYVYKIHIKPIIETLELLNKNLCRLLNSEDCDKSKYCKSHFGGRMCSDLETEFFKNMFSIEFIKMTTILFITDVYKSRIVSNIVDGLIIFQPKYFEKYKKFIQLPITKINNILLSIGHIAMLPAQLIPDGNVFISAPIIEEIVFRGLYTRFLNLIRDKGLDFLYPPTDTYSDTDNVDNDETIEKIKRLTNWGIKMMVSIFFGIIHMGNFEGDLNRMEFENISNTPNVSIFTIKNNVLKSDSAKMLFNARIIQSINAGLGGLLYHEVSEKSNFTNEGLKETIALHAANNFYATLLQYI